MHKMFLTIALASLALMAGSVSAQSKNGTVRGVVRDASKLAIPGVQVGLINPETRTGIKTITNESGEYRFDVPPAAYQLYAYLPGFKLLRGPDLKLNESETIQKELTLTVDSATFQLLGQ